MKKLYTGSIKKLTVKNINIFPAAIEKIAFEKEMSEEDFDIKFKTFSLTKADIHIVCLTLIQGIPSFICLSKA